MTASPSDGQPSIVRLDADQIRVLAHPLRARLLAALRSDGPATATRLAEVLGTNTGATSYHLRQLAQAGLVVEEAERGTGRQRWWRAAHQLSNWHATDFDDQPDAAAAADWLYRNALRVHAEQAERWIETQRDYPAEWREAAELSDCLLRLTPHQLRQLIDELHAVLDRYRHALVPVDTPPGGQEPAAPDGTERVLLYLHAFPVRGPIPLAAPRPAAPAADEETR
ncbi:winged helix-turn-helix domain-containing protein [Micromonospora sp. HM5-17]|jgi:predicted ArsR family transcriptional regulator|uniref:winged helix-turn-helix domain-containing protein n=1 Tax=Micromonospora sp. HM5-17 TaxID=2487710 RepID=UPI000F4A6BB1|nr:winged helix-turn-helix domain-containing protein [Micromonospora sp. HM5-17]ROT33293.1 ArsR family transcriptional regulator [Micromonospora sp. HM5-17]